MFAQRQVSRLLQLLGEGCQENGGGGDSPQGMRDKGACAPSLLARSGAPTHPSEALTLALALNRKVHGAQGLGTGVTCHQIIKGWTVGL